MDNVTEKSYTETPSNMVQILNIGYWLAPIRVIRHI